MKNKERKRRESRNNFGDLDLRYAFTRFCFEKQKRGEIFHF